MPAFQSLVLTDRQATPVNWTLTPVGEPSNGVFTVAVADASGASISEIQVSVSTRRVNGKQKSVMKFTFPTIVNETINGVVVPRRARVQRFTLNVESEDTHTTVEKNNNVGMFHSAFLANKALIHNILVLGEGVW